MPSHAIPGRCTVSTMLSRLGALTTPLKLLALAGILFKAPLAWVPPVAEHLALLSYTGRWGMFAAYIATIVLSFAGLLLVPFLRDWRIRLPLALVLLVGFATDQAFLNMSGHYMTLDMMTTIWRERAMATAAWVSYGRTIMVSAVLGFCAFVAFAVPPAANFSVRRLWAVAPLAALILSAGIIHRTSGLIEAFPSPYLVPAQLAVAIVFPPEENTFDRLPVAYEGPLRPLARKIVMVVDESVRGDRFQLNDPAYDNTPFLAAHRSAIANYGIATSASNCSVAARLIMRIGLRESQLPDTGQIWRRLPTVWDYAEKAGLKTVLVDVWRPVGLAHSYMSLKEAATIDLWQGPPQSRDYSDMTDSHLRDIAAADMVIDLLREEEPMLIYVNKWGIHPPYSSGAPSDYEYVPDVESDLERLAPEYHPAISDYHRAVRWSVDRFFQRVLPALEGSDAVLMYTSDHGQALYEGGYELSHCSVSPTLHRGEVFVPMFITASSPDVLGVYRAAADRGFNRATHFQVFPTLLEMMGYAPDWVENQYGPSLLRFHPERPRKFLLGTVFSPAARWVDVD